MGILGNEKWDLFEGIPKGYTVRMKVRLKLENSSAGTKWDILQTCLSLITCAFYVASTYNKGDSGETETDKSSEMVFLCLFLIDYLLRFYCCVNRFIYPFTFNAIVDFLTILPSLLDMVMSTSKTPTFQFMRFARILRVTRMLRTMKVSSGGGISGTCDEHRV